VLRGKEGDDTSGSSGTGSEINWVS